jgi:hypothetical protein
MADGTRNSDSAAAAKLPLRAIASNTSRESNESFMLIIIALFYIKIFE